MFKLIIDQANTQPNSCRVSANGELKNGHISGLQFAILLSIALALLIPRLDGLNYFPGKYLWAEDGNIFINQAQAMGIASLWSPYAGYLLAYPRLIALIANNSELVNRPIFMLAGWFLSYLFMFSILIRKARDLGSGFISLVFLIILVSLQPHYGENFFNITNAQWMLGAGFSVLVLTCTNETFQLSIPRLFLLTLLGLTGPFSIILMPLLAVKAIIFKDFKKNLWLYLAVLGCAIAQTLVLLNSSRLISGRISVLPWDWLVSFLEIALFGANDLITLGAALCFWAIFIAIIVANKQSAADTLPLLAIVTAVLFIIAAQYANKNNPMAITALGGGNRYTWIPYALIFFSAMIVSNNRRLIQIIIFTLALFICYKNFHQVTSPNLQFKSFANFANYANIVIPIHPQWPTFPGWYINGISSGSKSIKSIVKINIDLSQFSAYGAELEEFKLGLQIISKTNDPILILKEPIICGKAADVAIEINMKRSSEGWMQLFWDKDRKFSGANSLRRWYPIGSTKAQFAFPNNEDGIYLRFDPLEHSGSVEINKVTVYCLP